MTSNGPDDKSKKIDGSNTSEKNEGGRPTNQSEAAKAATSAAKPSKKPVILDLEAKDLTPKADEKGEDKEKSQSTNQKKNDNSSMPSSDSSSSKNKDAKTGEANSVKTAPAAPKKSGTKSTDAKPAQAKPTPPKSTAIKSQKRGLFSTLVVAVCGGIVAILGLLAMQLANIFPSPFTNQQEVLIADLQTRFEQLEEAGQVKTAPLSGLEALQERVSGLEEELKTAISEEVPDEVAARLTALEARLASAEANMTDQNPPATTGASDETAISQRISALETRLSIADEARVSRSDLSTALSALATRIDDLTGLVEGGAIADTDGLAVLNEKISSLATKVATLDAGSSSGGAPVNEARLVEAARSALSPEFFKNIEAVDTAIKNVDATLKAAEANITSLAENVALVTGETASLGDGFETTVGKLASLEQSLSSQTPVVEDIQATTSILAVESFKRAVISGGPFSNALSALKRTGISSDLTNTIEAYADNGLGDKASLSLELGELIAKAVKLAKAGEGEVAVETEESEPLSAFEKLIRNARGLVAIKNIDEETASPSSPLNTLMTMFEAGDVEGFVSAMSALAGDQKSLFEPWLVKWKAGLSLNELLGELEAHVGEPNDITSHSDATVQ